MATYDDHEPTELEIEEQRAGIEPERRGDLFEHLQADGWLAGLENGGGEKPPPEGEPGDDPDAERMAEHQRRVTGRPEIRFLPPER
ncbi:MAG TPA: hypothetical protein VGJ28_07160 [Micromonosporaceae bacterium]|jgi:hypothetical protein